MAMSRISSASLIIRCWATHPPRSTSVTSGIADRSDRYIASVSVDGSTTNRSKRLPTHPATNAGIFIVGGRIATSHLGSLPSNPGHSSTIWVSNRPSESSVIDSGATSRNVESPVNPVRCRTSTSDVINTAAPASGQSANDRRNRSTRSFMRAW